MHPTMKEKGYGYSQCHPAEYAVDQYFPAFGNIWISGLCTLCETWKHGSSSPGSVTVSCREYSDVAQDGQTIYMDRGKSTGYGTDSAYGTRGGNNSTFTTRVVTSSGSDTYSTIAAAMSSLKGPKHGGANIKVMEMIEYLSRHVSDYSDKDEIAAYLGKILDKETFDRQGLIYGMGHAVYSLSDPRERILRKYVEELAKEKGSENELMLYRNIEEIAPQVIAAKRHIYKGVSPNVDFYSGFVYKMLGIPTELYTAIFAIARIIGWSAHRIEELVNMSKIIRPAYMSVMRRNTDVLS